MSEKSFDIQVSAVEIAKEIKEAARQSITEEDLRIRTENILRAKVLDKLGIPCARYEYTLVSGGRTDALYGHVILEYEKPNAFKTKAGFENAIKQVKRYITDKARFKDEYKRYFGVVLDGFKIGFLRYIPRLEDWEEKGPIDVNQYTILKLLEAIRGLVRKPLDANLLIKDLGPGSRVARNAVNIFYRKVKEAKVKRTKMLFNDWKRVFSQVCAYSPEKIRGLEKVYGIKERDIDYDALLFSIHSYYALVMKILAAEVAVLYGGYFLQSYTKKLEGAYLRSPELLRTELQDLEEGGVFTNLGITNFLEADYFAWYLDEWDKEVADTVIGVVKRISEYEPGTAELEPDVVRDLFKRLYQNLVPKKIRHDLGEYYTPDWLAELLLNQTGFNLESFENLAEGGDSKAPLELRFLDPACGSGTFLVLAIKRIKEYAKEHFLEGEALKYIVKNIVGFDLNPLAVLASRANYLLALGELIRTAMELVELPVYFADSILAERRSTLTGEEYVLKTTAGEFSIPISTVEKGLLGVVLSLAEDCVRLGYASREFKARLLREIPDLGQGEVQGLMKLFEKLSKLEKKGENKIWTRILKNSFAPLFSGEFDYVIGNPPWIAWDNLPRPYREATKKLWFRYGLFTLSGMEARLGGGKKDIAMLFTYACSDRYLKVGGMFGFLLTQAVFKTKGAGEGFRRFKLREHPLRIVEVYDLVDIKPFEGASNRTTFLIFKKGEKTSYPVPYIVWRKKGAIEPMLPLDEVIKRIAVEEMVATPADPKKLNTPWLTIPKQAFHIVKVLGQSHYHAHAGIYSGGANAVYWLKPIRIIRKKEKVIEVPLRLQRLFERIYATTVAEGKAEVSIRDILIENLTEGAKRKVEKVQMALEDFLIFPLIKSRHLKKWKIDGYIYTILVQDPLKRVGYNESWLKTELPKTFAYLKKFEDMLRSRAAYKKYFKETDPFYAMFDIGEYTFSPYRVVWNQMGNTLVSTVASTVNDPYLGNKMIIPEHVLGIISTEDEDEAHYICAVLNSSVANLILQSIAGGTKSFGTPSFIEKYLNIAKYNPNNSTHRKLSELSKRAHELAAKANDKELAKVEEEVNELAAKIYGLTDKEYREIKKSIEV